MAKKLKEEDLVLNIIVNGNKGQKEAAALGRQMRDAKIEVESLVSEQKKLEKQGKQNTARYKEVTAEIAKNNAVIDTNRKKLFELGQSFKLTDQSISQLKRSLSQLTKLKNQAVPGSAQYKQYETQIQAINNRLSELGVRARGTGRVLNNMGSSISRFFTSITAGILSFVAVISGIKKATDEFSKFDDKLADVQKTTDLAKGTVKEFSDELDKMITRTSHEDLLGLGRIGGKLGISDKNELLGFVDSMNKIVVALNEDLGGNVEETVNQMGKLVDVFGVKNTFGMEEGILKVGSAINELGKASTANEGYLVDFGKRMGGVSPLAKISVQEILGLGATLDQLGQSSEVSSTSLSRLFLNMSKDAATFSKYAGMEVNSFKELLENDFMGAFTKVLQGVKGNSAGINELAATLGDLGLDGQRVIGVIGTLANNHHILTDQIELSNKAFDDGTSVIDEYNIKNETAAAKLEISRKEVTKFWRELGEKLYPAITSANTGLVAFLKAIMSIIEFLQDNYRWILTITVAISGYTIAVKAAAIATGVQTAAVKVATIAQRLWNATIALNPFGALLVVLTTVLTAIALYSKRVTAAEAATIALNDTLNDAKKASMEQTSAIQRNIEIMQDKTKTTEQQLIAVQNLRDIMPGVLQNYTDEEILAGKATAAIKEQTTAILAQAKVRAFSDKITDLEIEKLDLLEKQSKGWAGSNWKERLAAGFTKNAEQGYLDKITNDIETVDKKIESFKENLLSSQEEVNKFYKANQVVNEFVPAGGGGVTPDETDKEKRKREAAEKARQKLAEEMAEWNKRLEKDRGFAADKEMEQLEKKYKELLKTVKKGSKEETEITATYEKLKWERSLEIMQEGAQKYRERQLSEMDELFAEKQTKDQENYLAELQALDAMSLSEEERNIRREALKLEQEALERTREQERLTARLLLLENFQNIGDLEIAEAQRVADEKAKIEKQLIDNSITENIRLANQKQDISKKIAESELAIKEATIAAFEAGFGVLGDLFKENKKLSNLFLILEKTAAAASVIVNLQKEISGYYAANAALGVAGAAIATKLALAAKIRAGASLAAIAGQTISGIAQNNKSGGSKGSGSKTNPRPSTQGSGRSNARSSIRGREKGGFLVRRSQDGKNFNASLDPAKRGYVAGPTVIVGENGSEFVANAQAVANPSVKHMLDIIDIAQRNGSISTLNLERILFNDQKTRMPGRETGGSIGVPAPVETSVSQTNNFDEINKNQKELALAIQKLNTQISRGITAEVALLGKNGFVEKQKELNNLENKANI